MIFRILGAVALLAAGPSVAEDLVAEDQTPTGRYLTATEVRPILQATRANWVAVRDYEGQDWVYVTHLWSWRCGLLRIEMAVNDGAAEIWPIPDCHVDMPQPAVLLETDGLPVRTFSPGSIKSLTLTVTYDDLGTQTETFQRQEVLIP